MRNPLPSDCRRVITGAFLCLREASVPCTFPPGGGKDNLTGMSCCRPRIGGAPSTGGPNTAVQTTKSAEHTENERLTRGTPLNGPVGASVARNLCEFVYFGSFVVPTALSPEPLRRGERGESRLKSPPKLFQGAFKAIARLFNGSTWVLTARPLRPEHSIAG
jgi:hypothetical protein